MALKRTDLILHRVEANIRLIGKTVPDPDVILDRMDQCQQNICERAFVLKFEDDIDLEAGTDIIDLGLKIFQIKSLAPPATWRNFPAWCWSEGYSEWRLKIVTSTREWDELKNSFWKPTHPVAAMVWNQRLRLWPAPNVTGEKLHAFMYLIPQAKLDLGTDPEILTQYDRTLELGTTGYIVGGDFITAYESELARINQQALKEVADGQHQIRHWSDATGF